MARCTDAPSLKPLASLLCLPAFFLFHIPELETLQQLLRGRPYNFLGAGLMSYVLGARQYIAPCMDQSIICLQVLL